jgi:hypothetical protein
MQLDHELHTKITVRIILLLSRVANFVWSTSSQTLAAPGCIYSAVYTHNLRHIWTFQRASKFKTSSGRESTNWHSNTEEEVIQFPNMGLVHATGSSLRAMLSVPCLRAMLAVLRCQIRFLKDQILSKLWGLMVTCPKIAANIYGCWNQLSDGTISFSIQPFCLGENAFSEFFSKNISQVFKELKS